MRSDLSGVLRAVVSPLFFYFRNLVIASVFFGVLSGVASGLEAARVCVDQHCFDVEVAQSPAQREQGLMNRAKLGVRSGMWFVFDRPDRYAFWMKNTRVPLDIIWVSPQGRVVDIFHQATQGRLVPMVPRMPAQYVLEVNGGLSRAYQFNVGDRVVFKP